MPPPPCLRSVLQLSLDRTAHTSIACRRLRDASQAAAFSTAAARFAAAAPKKGGKSKPARALKTLNLKKGKKGGKAGGQDHAKTPALGERKALRKRIVLSNNNALEVSSLVDLDHANVLDAEHEGHVRGIPEEAVDALRAVDAFKRTQGWSLFRRPAVLMRKETTQLAQLLKEVEESGHDGAKKKTVRRILSGARMSGKSTLLLQGLMMAHLRDWVIINLPEAQDIVNAHTEYAPLPGSQPTQYTQDVYTANLLSQMQKANKKIFENTLVKTNPSLPSPLPSNCTLKQLADMGIADPEMSWPVFVALWSELTLPGRPPIMFALDGLAHVMRHSAYLSADVKPIHAHDLSLIRHFVDHLSGRTALPNGGMILAATSSSNTPANPAVDFSLQVAEARQFAPESVPLWNPYKNVDQRVMECLKDVDVLKITGLSKDEARAIMEYYAESGMLRAKVDDGFVSEKWSLAGMGNMGELERTSVRMRVEIW